MGMDKRDFCFAQCCTYLLAWLIRDAGAERYHIMKGRLTTIHRTLDDEDEATSEPEPEPNWMASFKREGGEGGTRATRVRVKAALAYLHQAQATCNELPETGGILAARFMLVNSVESAKSVLELLRQEDEETREEAQKDSG